ncbi:MAG: carbonic anhydrase [Thaumarchaeota archaeon]|nr:carbonic anhydrase [Nitrososphaerota archaeon]MBI3641657.1 carbonic anhydrase [Nitrososphaerota archaeon]
MLHWPNIHENVKTDFNAAINAPQIKDDAFIHPFAIVIGDCHIGKMVLMAPTAVCRGDEGTPLYIGDYSNIQDGVILHALETTINEQNIDGRRFSANGDMLMANDSRFVHGYAIFVGDRVSLAHDSMVHGPAWIGNDTFVGMKSLIFNAKVGSNVAVGVSSTITGGVVIPDNKFVSPGSVIVTQQQADALPSRIGSPYENINKDVIHVNENLAEGYSQQDIEKIKEYREALMEEEGLETARSSP